MEHYDYLIIGNGVAGMTAAEAIRARDASASIAIASDEPHPLYSRVLLPSYVKGTATREQMFLRKTADYVSKNILLLGGETAERLDTSKRTLLLKSGTELGFRKLLLASGGRPQPLNTPGEELPGVSRFQTIEDADAMREFLPTVRRAVVVGGGFIALEYLEILAQRNIPVTLVLPYAHFLGRFMDAAGGRILTENFERYDIEVVANDRLRAIDGGETVQGIQTEMGCTLEADFLGIGIGLLRDTAWLESSGLNTSANGVITDEFLGTSVPGIFAAGDAADFYDITLGFRHTHGNWGNAFRQGELAGRNMVAPASRETYRSVTSYGIRNLGLQIALVGHVAGGPGIEAVSSVAPDGKYGRFFLQGKRLVGAALINRHEDRPVISRMIGEAVPLNAAARQNLEDPAFDIKTLVA